MNKRYCRYCGKEMELGWSGYYDENTGEREMIFMCNCRIKNLRLPRFD